MPLDIAAAVDRLRVAVGTDLMRFDVDDGGSSSHEAVEFWYVHLHAAATVGAVVDEVGMRRRRIGVVAAEPQRRCGS